MPANRSRTTHWRRSLEQVRSRNGAIEIAVAGPPGDGVGTHLVWRVRLLELTETEIVVEQPVALGHVIRLEPGIDLVAVMSVGQNRWMFRTTHLGSVEAAGSHRRGAPAMRLRMPENVQRCQRRANRVSTTDLRLPRVDMWPLLDPKSAVLAERAAELRASGGRPEGGSPAASATLADAGLMPEVGPVFQASLINIGGGGVGICVAPEHQQGLSRQKLFWLSIALLELDEPVCASAKLVHTHMRSDQNVYAGLAFDFSFNAGYRYFVVERIRGFVKLQQTAGRQRGAA